jgi:hypothetical protein
VVQRKINILHADWLIESLWFSFSAFLQCMKLIFKHF